MYSYVNLLQIHPNTYKWILNESYVCIYICRSLSNYQIQCSIFCLFTYILSMYSYQYRNTSVNLGTVRECLEGELWPVNLVLGVCRVLLSIGTVLGGFDLPDPLSVLRHFCKLGNR